MEVLVSIYFNNDQVYFYPMGGLFYKKLVFGLLMINLLLERNFTLLPIEEWLFFIIIPFCCVFYFRSLAIYFSKQFNKY